MKIIIISKDNYWTSRLIEKLKTYELDFIYFNKTLNSDIKKYNPDWIFFFHWSDMVEENIYSNYKCAVVHTGILPEHRGGSPLQNQIIKGIVKTRVNIIEMTDPVDSGAIYCSQDITLQGSINDIWYSIADITSELIIYCVDNNPLPKPQQGTPQTFKRIKDNTIKINENENINSIYDQIRMVDGASYPLSYMEINGFKLEFSRAKLEDEEILADVRIKKIS